MSAIGFMLPQTDQCWFIITILNKRKKKQVPDVIMSSCPLLWRLIEAELLVIRPPSLNQCTIGTGKPLTVQCMETSVARATVMLSGPRMMWILFGTPVRQDITQF